MIEGVECLVASVANKIGSGLRRMKDDGSTVVRSKIPWASCAARRLAFRRLVPNTCIAFFLSIRHKVLAKVIHTNLFFGLSGNIMSALPIASSDAGLLARGSPTRPARI
jgi:hypothetical protein